MVLPTGTGFRQSGHGDRHSRSSSYSNIQSPGIDRFPILGAGDRRPLLAAGTRSLAGSITPVLSVEAVEPVWRALEARSRSHFFLSWTWIGSWLRLVRDTTPVWLFECRHGDRTVALALLTRFRGRRLKRSLPSTQVLLNEFLADGYNMVMAYNGLLAEPGMEQRAWDCFLDAARKWDEAWDEISLGSLPDGELPATPDDRSGLRVRPDKTFVRWAVPLRPECARPDALLRRMKRKSRQQLRQSLRAYGRLGDLSLRVASNTEEAHAYFDRLEELHTARWEAIGQHGSFQNPRWARFHRDLIDHGFDTGQVQLLEVRCADFPIGLLYGHQYGDTVYMHQTGFYLTDDNALRTGYVCHFEAMRHFAAKGLRNYDLLPDQADSYKRFFADPGEPIHWVQLQRPRLRFGAERLIRRLWSTAGPATAH